MTDRRHRKYSLIARLLRHDLYKLSPEEADFVMWYRAIKATHQAEVADSLLRALATVAMLKYLSKRAIKGPRGPLPGSIRLAMSALPKDDLLKDLDVKLRSNSLSEAQIWKLTEDTCLAYLENYFDIPKQPGGKFLVKNCCQIASGKSGKSTKAVRPCIKADIEPLEATVVLRRSDIQEWLRLAREARMNAKNEVEDKTVPDALEDKLYKEVEVKLVNKLDDEAEDERENELEEEGDSDL